MIMRFIYQLGSPPYFYALSGRLLPWLTGICFILFATGLYGGLVLAPAVYMVMAFSGAMALIWRIKIAEIMLINSAHIGAVFTFLALVTGSIWGKPMWGTWWVWDARLTSELLLLFLYLGVIALHSAIDDKRKAARAVAILALVGVVNIPIIHYSVEWWSTLHQGPTVTKFNKPSIDTRMLIPLLLMAVAFKFFYAIVVLLRARNDLLWRERRSQWVATLFKDKP